METSGATGTIPDHVLQKLHFEDPGADIGTAFMMSRKENSAISELDIKQENDDSSGDVDDGNPSAPRKLEDTNDDPPPLPENGPPEDPEEGASVAGTGEHRRLERVARTSFSRIGRIGRPRSKPPAPPVRAQPTRIPSFGPLTPGLETLQSRIVQRNMISEEMESEEQASTSEIQPAEPKENDDVDKEQDQAPDTTKGEEEEGQAQCILRWISCGISKFWKK